MFMLTSTPKALDNYFIILTLTINQMRLLKRNLETVFLAFRGTEGVLSLKEARVRDPFMKELTEVTSRFEVDRKKIYEKFCKKNEDGTPDTADNKYSFDAEVVEEVNAELATLLDEEVEIEASEGLKEILEKTDYRPKSGETEIIDEVLAKL